MQSQRTPWKIGQLFIAINEIIIEEEIILYYIRRTNITNVIIHQGRIGKSRINETQCRSRINFT